MNCRSFEKCGACSLLAMDYGLQLEKKRQAVEDAFRSYRIPVRVHRVEGMEDPRHYRNKVIVYVTCRAGKTVLGMYEENTHRIVPVYGCLLHDRRLDAILEDIRLLLNKLKILPAGYGGVLKNVMLRVGVKTGQVMVVFVTEEDMFHGHNDLVKKLTALHPEIRTIVQNVNPRHTDVILGNREKVLYGSGYIFDELLGYRFKISPRSFYQINPYQTEALYSKAITLAGLDSKPEGGGALVMDAYCGIGTIGICASKYASGVIGVEIVDDAVRDARSNARANSVANAAYCCDDAGAFMRGYGPEVDVLFVDPPRSGCDREFLDSVLALRPSKIVYISCNPETQARDVAYLGRAYTCLEAYPFDMFPHTSHVENVCLLSGRANAR